MEGQRLTAAVEPGRPGNGVYTVGYRVVSADGHPVTGSYKFTLADVSDEPPRPISTSAAAAPSTAAPPPSTAAPATSDTKTTVITQVPRVWPWAA